MTETQLQSERTTMDDMNRMLDATISDLEVAATISLARRSELINEDEAKELAKRYGIEWPYWKR